MKDELVLMFSNSLRNPLNVMLSTIAVLKDQNVGSEDSKRALEVIRASTREQRRLIDEVHDLSCITAGCFEIEKQPVHPSTFSCMRRSTAFALSPLHGVFAWSRS